MAEYKIWWIRGGKLGVGEFSDSNNKITAFTADDIDSYSLRVWFTKQPTQFTTTLTTEPNIPEQFHEGVVHRVLAKLYNIAAGKAANEGKIEAAQALLALARINMGEWKNFLLEGKKHVNIGKEYTPIKSIPHEF